MHTQLIRLSGWGMVVAAVSLLLTFMSLCLALLGYVLQANVPLVNDIALLQA